jgi:hypothetical protein
MRHGSGKEIKFCRLKRPNPWTRSADTPVETCHGDANRHSVAVLLKTVQHLGYFPDDLQQVPPAVRTFIAQRLQLLRDRTAEYPWHSSTRHRYLALIRQQLGWRFPTGQDKQALETWLRLHGARDAPTEEELCECAYARLRAGIVKLIGHAGVAYILATCKQPDGYLRGHLPA